MSEIHPDDRLRRIEEGIFRLETELPHLATKEAVAEVYTRLGKIETELPHLVTKGELAEVRTDLARTEIRLIKWAIGIGVAAVLVLSARRRLPAWNPRPR